jgi:hypothetical protein
MAYMIFKNIGIKSKIKRKKKKKKTTKGLSKPNCYFYMSTHLTWEKNDTMLSLLLLKVLFECQETLVQKAHVSLIC